MDWGRLIQGGVDARAVPGKHETILKEPDVRDLARALTTALADSRAGMTAPQYSPREKSRLRTRGCAAPWSG
jgi:hypothetical protein